jgi:hypothetical protein
MTFRIFEILFRKNHIHWLRYRLRFDQLIKPLRELVSLYWREIELRRIDMVFG